MVGPPPSIQMGPNRSSSVEPFSNSSQHNQSAAFSHHVAGDPLTNMPSRLARSSSVDSGLPLHLDKILAQARAPKENYVSSKIKMRKKDKGKNGGVSKQSKVHKNDMQLNPNQNIHGIARPTPRRQNVLTSSNIAALVDHLEKQEQNTQRDRELSSLFEAKLPSSLGADVKSNTPNNPNTTMIEKPDIDMG